MKITESEIKLSNGTEFKIYHNLEDFGLSVESALDNWLSRTKNYDAKSFCRYITSKDPVNLIALTEKEFKIAE